ncbi:MAG: hypothetical protein PVI27_04775 [Desulfobacteraceae bacterium]
MNVLKAFGTALLWGVVTASPAPGADQSAGDLMNEFGQAFEALRPPAPGSSVNSDYKIGQTALGTYYTTKTLGLIYDQNQELSRKYDQMLEKYDEVIQQNLEIIRLLRIMTGKQTEDSP